MVKTKNSHKIISRSKYYANGKKWRGIFVIVPTLTTRCFKQLYALRKMLLL